MQTPSLTLLFSNLLVRYAHAHIRGIVSSGDSVLQKWAGGERIARTTVKIFRWSIEVLQRPPCVSLRDPCWRVFTLQRTRRPVSWSWHVATRVRRKFSEQFNIYLYLSGFRRCNAKGPLQNASHFRHHKTNVHVTAKIAQFELYLQ